MDKVIQLSLNFFFLTASLSPLLLLVHSLSSDFVSGVPRKQIVRIMKNRARTSYLPIIFFFFFIFFCFTPQVAPYLLHRYLCLLDENVFILCSENILFPVYIVRICDLSFFYNLSSFSENSREHKQWRIPT